MAWFLGITLYAIAISFVVYLVVYRDKTIGWYLEEDPEPEEIEPLFIEEEENKAFSEIINSNFTRVEKNKFRKVKNDKSRKSDEPSSG